jgi:putative ABC transport system permease protein
MDAEASRRSEVRAQVSAFTSVLTPVVLAGCGVWVAMLALSNARERRGEVGILRALGVSSGAVLAMFLGKAAVIGLAGAALGAAAGLAIGAGYSGGSIGQVISPTTLALVLLGAPLLTALASWLPSLAAAQQDPAAVLGGE